MATTNSGIIGNAMNPNGSTTTPMVPANAIPTNGMTASGNGTTLNAPAASTYNPTLLGTPTQLTVSPNQTVQGQLQSINDPNSPIIQQARTQALQQANSRGLLNSSIAQTGADEAAYAASIPIATADAATYNNAAGYNANVSNAFEQQNTNAKNTAGQFDAGQQNTLTGQQLSANTSLSNTAANNESSKKITQMQEQAQASFQGASNLTQLSNNYQSTISQIGQLNMDSASKQALQQNVFEAYQQATKALDQKLGIPDTSGLLNFNPSNPANANTNQAAISAPANTGIISNAREGTGGI